MKMNYIQEYKKQQPGADKSNFPGIAKAPEMASAEKKGLRHRRARRKYYR